MVRQALHMLGHTIGVEPSHGRHGALVQPAPPFGEQAAIRHLVGERVLEGVFAVREQAGLVQELVLLEISEPLMQCLLRQPGDGREDGVRHVLADD
jgi:hypothetical protein